MNRKGKTRVPNFARPKKAKKPVEKRIPIKKATMQMLIDADGEVKVAAAQLEAAQKGFQDTVRPILSENDLERAVVKQVTQKPPYELIVEVPPK